MTIRKLELANDEEAAKYSASRIHVGLHPALSYITMDPLAVAERQNSRGYDHIHLSQVNETMSPSGKCVQWWGRASSGYHYPIGRVMKMVKNA